jgi:hypothetical protein
MDAFNQGDVSRMLAALSENVEVYAPPELATPGNTRATTASSDGHTPER